MTSPLTIDRLKLRLPPSMQDHAEAVAEAMSSALADLHITEARRIDALSLGPISTPADGNPRTLGRNIAQAIAHAAGVRS